MAQRVFRSKAFAFFALSAFTALPAHAQAVGQAAGSLDLVKERRHPRRAERARSHPRETERDSVRSPRNRTRFLLATGADQRRGSVGPEPRRSAAVPTYSDPSRCGSTTRHSMLAGRAVEHSQVDGPAARFAEALRGKDEVGKQLEAVNWYVNGASVSSMTRPAVRPGRRLVAGERDAPQRPRRLRGLCDRQDADAARRRLRRERSLLVIVPRIWCAAPTMRCSSRAPRGHMYVLDNGTDEVLDSESVTDYRPILTFASNGDWTHGYRMRPAPMKSRPIAAPPRRRRQPISARGARRFSPSAPASADRSGCSCAR